MCRPERHSQGWTVGRHHHRHGDPLGSQRASAVRGDVAMTGEVTLRGRVLPVGGVREKALAALRSGISTVILPESNLQDLDEIPKELRRKITFVGVSHMDEVLEAALEEMPARMPTPQQRRRAIQRRHLAT